MAQTLTLTSNQLEHWFATVERDNKASSNSDSVLCTQFLNRFGLQNPQEVIEFLKTSAGKMIISVIGQELMKIKSLGEQSRAEAIKLQIRLTFLLMAFITKENANAKQVSEIIQQQIDKKLKEKKPSEVGKSQPTVSREVINQNILYYEQTLDALNEHQNEIKQKKAESESLMVNLEEEGLQMVEYHEEIDDYLDELDEYLRFPVLINEPKDQYSAYIAALIAELDALKAQHAALHVDDGTSKTESYLSKKIKRLEDKIDFFKEPPRSAEQLFEELLDKIKFRKNILKNEFETVPQRTPYVPSVEGLGLQERGLQDVLHVLRKQKILLDWDLKEVDDYSQAYLIIDPSERSRYQKKGDDYVIFSKEMDPIKLSDDDWLNAKLNFDRLKPEVRVVRIDFEDRKQQQVASYLAKKKSIQTKIDEYQAQIDTFEDSKKDFSERLSRARTHKGLFTGYSTPAVTPKPTPAKTRAQPDGLTPKPSTQQSKAKSSYALMMRSLEGLVPQHAPAPQKEVIRQVKREIEAVIPEYRKKELNDLIKEVIPGQIMEPKVRLGWLYRAQRLIPGMPSPELGSTLDPRKVTK